jgi:hypothetical protein
MVTSIASVRRARLLTLGLSALLFVSFAHVASATDLSGSWSGQWYSCCSRHHGPLKASFCKVDDTSYEVSFKGRFFKVLPFRYSVTLNVVSDDGQTVKLAGSNYLGRMFGTFSYQATATETSFEADYFSCKDNGRFEMCRCSAPCSR